MESGKLAAHFKEGDCVAGVYGGYRCKPLCRQSHEHLFVTDAELGMRMEVEVSLEGIYFRPGIRRKIAGFRVTDAVSSMLRDELVLEYLRESKQKALVVHCERPEELMSSRWSDVFRLRRLSGEE